MRPTESVLQAAIARKEAAKAEFEKWCRFIEALQELEKTSQEVPVLEHAKAGSDGPAQPFVSPTPKRKVTRRETAKTETLAIQIIKRLGRPVQTSEMLTELAKLNMVVPGVVPASTLSTRLGRSNRLYNKRNVGWQIVEADSKNETPSNESDGVSQFAFGSG